MRNVRKRPPTIKLVNLLRRRGHSLDSWMASAGVSSYVEVVRWCNKIGVLPPDEATYKALRPEQVSSPSDGIVVAMVEPKVTIGEVKEVALDPSSEDFEWPNMATVESVEMVEPEPKKKSRRKSETVRA